jgi:hypothetical protein
MWLRSRGWLNVLFWILWSAGTVASLYIVGATTRETRVSLAIAIGALWLNLFPRFLQGPKLKASVNQITVLSITGADQAALVTDIAVHDLLSPEPSTAAKATLANLVFVREAVQARDAEALRVLFQQTDPRRYRYIPPDSLIEQFLHDRRATPAFFLPLVVYNMGGRFGDIASVVMVAQNLTSLTASGRTLPTWRWMSTPSSISTSPSRISKSSLASLLGAQSLPETALHSISISCLTTMWPANDSPTAVWFPERMPCRFSDSTLSAR